MYRAACRDLPREWFFPVDASGAEPPEPDPLAVAVCDRCLVRPECFTWAVATGSEGTWAGTSTHQRRQLARRYRRRDCPVCHEPDGVVEVGDHQVCVRCAISWLAVRAHPTGATRTRAPSHPAG
jgi:WhiB family redox-sensing transcriptional regulator